jgi:hypothetical protein
MTTSTPRADTPATARFPLRARPPHPARSPRAGRTAFTLTEVIVASALSAFILVGILSTFLLIGRTGLNASAYAEMNTRLRSALERFDRDVRLAEDVRWDDERSVTLLLPATLGPDITYAFAPAADPAAPGRFTRRVDGAATETLVRDISPDFAFRYYKRPQTATADEPAGKDYETLLIEVRLRALRPDSRAPSASQLALSARCYLRNKNVGS